MKEPVFVHFKNTRNLGDRSCCPQRYFPEFENCRVVDWQETAAIDAGTPLILGGGGLLMMHTHKLFGELAKRHPVIIWGAGLNYSLGDDYGAELLLSLRKCSLVGLRNRAFASKHGFRWVPCASVMSPLFDDPGDEIYDTLFIYQHADRKFAPYGVSNVADNNARSFESVIGRMKNNWTVLTNSYHGAYWAHMARRRVILWRPREFGIRFDDFTFPVAESFEQVVRIMSEKPDPHVNITNSSLGVARAANRQFRDEVLDFLQKL